MKATSLPVYDLRLVRARKPLRLSDGSEYISQSREAANVFHQLFGAADREHFGCLFTDSGHRLTGAHIIAIGRQSGLDVDLRTIFRAAIVMNAAGLILGHNHPSGSTIASPQDVALTRQVVIASKLLGIHVLDHIIVTPDVDCYSSMFHTHCEMFS